MARILVIHYDQMEAIALAERIRREGHECDAYPRRGAGGFRAISEAPPDAIVIDLVRLPSYGRAMGALLRERKSTRMVPLVFLTGDPEKTKTTREILPDAVYTALPGIGKALRRAIERRPANPVLPDPNRVPLAKKLRVGEGSIVAVLHAPEGMEARLQPLPSGARIQRKMDGADVVLLFVKSTAALGRELPALAGKVQKGRTFWICWPKQKSGQASDLNMLGIRAMCQAAGLTDYKSCSVDETWSGMAIAARR